MSKLRIRPIPCKFCGKLFSHRSYRRFNCDAHYRRNLPAVESERKEKISQSKRGKKRGQFSKEWLQHLSESAQKGSKNHNWKGGVTSLNATIRKSAKYVNWRKGVFERDDHTCVICKKKGGDLNAHHIYPFSTHDHLRFDIGNGVSLCLKCHRKEHVVTTK